MTDLSGITAPSSSLQKLYLLSLTEKNPGIWTDPNQVRLLTRRRGLARPAYVWDLHRLADTVGLPSSSALGYREIATNVRYWRPLWATQFSDDAGANVFSPLFTGNAVASFTVGDAEAYRYRGDLTFHPLYSQLPGGGGSSSSPFNESAYGEQVILEALLYPAMPFVLTTTVPVADHYGPLFATNVSISVTGERGISPVEARVAFDGGRALHCVPKTAPAHPATTSVTETTGLDGDGNPITTSVTDFYRYRTANLSDCLVGAGVWTDVDQMRSDMEIDNDAEAADPTTRIVSMSLEMRQEVVFETTTPRAPRSDEHGPRFAAIQNRAVTGSFSYYSRNEDFNFPLDDAVTLYFGGNFLLPLPNITWQRGKLALRPGAGYVHTFNFIARSADRAVVNGFASGSGANGSSSSSLPVSEFAIGAKRLGSPPTVAV